MTIMTTLPKDKAPEALRTHFEALASDPSFKLSRSRRGTYVNPAVARDWKWFQLGASRAHQPAPAATPGVVRVCPECDIAGCRHLRAQQPSPTAQADSQPVHELDAVIAECEHGLPFDATSLATLKRVRDTLAAARAPADSVTAPAAGNWIAADDVNRLVRELDVCLNGEAGAAVQASLCDVVAQVRHETAKRGQPLLAAPTPTPQADSQPAPVRDYPPLPKPDCPNIWGGAYSKNQMRAYVDVDRATRAPADSGAAPADDALRAQVELLTRDCGRQASKIAELVADLKFQEEKHREDRARLQTLYEHQRGECWYWQGDGQDHLESLCNTLPVVIRADQLRALVATPPAQAADSVAAPAAGAVAGPGWKWVPANPTQEMLHAGWHHGSEAGGIQDLDLAYCAMLAAAPTPPAQAADSVLKDRQIAALVNDLRDIAVEFHGTQQLRERIARAVVPALKARAADSVLEDAARWQELRAQHEDDAAERCCVFAPNDMRECLVPVGSLPGELDAFIDAEIAARKQGGA